MEWDLSFNQIKSLPEEIGDLPLIYQKLDNNELASLLDSLSKMMSIRTLSLGDLYQK